jgi:hypothetical protein
LRRQKSVRREGDFRSEPETLRQVEGMGGLDRAERVDGAAEKVDLKTHLHLKIDPSQKRRNTDGATTLSIVSLF